MAEHHVFNNLTMGLRISRSDGRFYLYDRRYPGEFFAFDTLDECDKEYDKRIVVYRRDLAHGG